MKLLALFSVCSVAIFLSACSGMLFDHNHSVGSTMQVVPVTYTSDPSGAILYDYSGRSYGYTPATIFYSIAPENQHNGLAIIPEATVRWHSGVQVQVNAGQVNLRQALAYTIAAKRPKNMPALEEDRLFAKRLKAFKVKKSKQKNAYWQNYDPRQ